MKNLRGNLSLSLAGLALAFFLATSSENSQQAYSQLAAVEPSAAQQIWQIGNQPIGYLEDDKSTRSSTEMWNLSSSDQNIQFLKTNGAVQSGSSDIWQTLDSEARTSETRIANTPLQGQSTFSGPAPLSSFEMKDELNAPPQEDSSWWSSAVSSAEDWSGSMINDVHDYFFGGPDMNACPNGVCAGIGIRG